tara:strand:- start:2224 stop:3204 length:981 start_codon:yes stop_codon:yes gene_type:complete
MDRTILITLIIIFLLIFYQNINNNRKDNIEPYWGFFRKVVRKISPRRIIRTVRRSPKKIFRAVRKSPKKIYRAVRNPRKTFRGAKKLVKKAGSSTFGKIKKLGRTISRLAKKIARLDKVFIGLKNKIFTVGDVFKSVFGVTKDGFNLLTQSIKILIEVAQILYLVVDKLYKCNDGAREVAREVKKELDIIMNGLLAIERRAYNCITFKYGLSKEHFDKCILALFNFRIDIMSYTKKIDILLKNPRLFAQVRDTRKSLKYGKNKSYCENTRTNKNFKYSKSCNQCFNIYGLLAKGNRQLLGVIRLLNQSETLFRQLDGLRRNMNKLF